MLKKNDLYENQLFITFARIDFTICNSNCIRCSAFSCLEDFTRVNASSEVSDSIELERKIVTGEPIVDREGEEAGEENDR